MSHFSMHQYDFLCTFHLNWSGLNLSVCLSSYLSIFLPFFSSFVVSFFFSFFFFANFSVFVSLFHSLFISFSFFPPAFLYFHLSFHLFQKFLWLFFTLSEVTPTKFDWPISKIFWRTKIISDREKWIVKVVRKKWAFEKK